MTQSETTLNEWSEVGKLKPAGFGLYTKLFIIVAAYFIFPVMAAYFLNLMGWREGNWVLMGLMGFLDYFILFYPYAWLAIAGAGFAAGQPGGIKGLSNEDGIKKVKEWVPGVYRFAVRTIIGKQAIFILLALLPVAGNQATTAIILGNVLIVILGSSMADEAWKGHPFTRTVYLACCWLLTGAVAYWAAVTVWPDLRPFKAKAITTQVEEEIRKQHETVVTEALQGGILIKKKDAIKEKILAMKPHLTLEERLAELTPDERRVWEAANSNLAERALHGLKEQAGKIDNKIRSWSKDGSPAKTEERAPATTPSIPLVSKWEGVYTPSATTGRISIGHFLQGTYCLRGNVHEYRWQWHPSSGEFHEMTFQGKYRNGSRNSYTPSQPNEARIPFPGEPYAYGSVFLWKGDEKVYAVEGQRFFVPHGTELWLDTNLSDHKINRFGPEEDQRERFGHTLEVEKC